MTFPEDQNIRIAETLQRSVCHLSIPNTLPIPGILVSFPIVSNAKTEDQFGYAVVSLWNELFEGPFRKIQNTIDNCKIKFFNQSEIYPLKQIVNCFKEKVQD